MHDDVNPPMIETYHRPPDEMHNIRRRIRHFTKFVLYALRPVPGVTAAQLSTHLERVLRPENKHFEWRFGRRTAYLMSVYVF